MSHCLIFIKKPTSSTTMEENYQINLFNQTMKQNFSIANYVGKIILPLHFKLKTMKSHLLWELRLHLFL